MHSAWYMFPSNEVNIVLNHALWERWIRRRNENHRKLSRSSSAMCDCWIEGGRGNPAPGQVCDIMLQVSEATHYTASLD